MAETNRGQFLFELPSPSNTPKAPAYNFQHLWVKACRPPPFILWFCYLVVLSTFHVPWYRATVPFCHSAPGSASFKYSSPLPHC